MPGEHLRPLPDGMPSQTRVEVVGPERILINGREIEGGVHPGDVIVLEKPRSARVDRGSFGEFSTGLFPDGTREGQQYDEPNDGIVDLITALGPDGHLYFAATESGRPMVSDQPILEFLRGYGEAGRTPREQAIAEAREETADALEGKSFSLGILDRATEITVKPMSTNTAMIREYIHYFEIRLAEGEVQWSTNEKGRLFGVIKPAFLEVDETLAETPITSDTPEAERIAIEKANAKKRKDREKLSGIVFSRPEDIITPDGFTMAGMGQAVGEIKKTAIAATRRESAKEISTLEKEKAELAHQLAEAQAQLAIYAGAATNTSRLVDYLAKFGAISSLVLTLYSLNLIHGTPNFYEVLPTALSFMLTPAYTLVDVFNNPHGFVGRTVQRAANLMNNLFAKNPSTPLS